MPQVHTLISSLSEQDAKSEENAKPMTEEEKIRQQEKDALNQMLNQPAGTARYDEFESFGCEMFQKK